MFDGYPTSPGVTNRSTPRATATWRVLVMHRQTGALLRVGSGPLTLLGKDRIALEQSAMAGRDPAEWHAIATPVTRSFGGCA